MLRRTVEFADVASEDCGHRAVDVGTKMRKTGIDRRKGAAGEVVMELQQQEWGDRDGYDDVGSPGWTAGGSATPHDAPNHSTVDAQPAPPGQTDCYPLDNSSAARPRLPSASSLQLSINSRLYAHLPLTRPLLRRRPSR